MRIYGALMRLRGWPCSERRWLNAARLVLGLIVACAFLPLAALRTLTLSHPVRLLFLLVALIGFCFALRSLVSMVVDRKAAIRWQTRSTGLTLTGGPIRFLLEALEVLISLAAGLTFAYVAFPGATVSTTFLVRAFAVTVLVLVDTIIRLARLIVWRGVNPRIEVDPECIRVISTDGRPWIARWKDQPYANESLRSNRIALTDRNHPYQRVSMNGVPVTHAYLQNLLDHFREHPEDTAALGTPEGLDILKRITG